MKIEHCRSCKAPVVWLKASTGKAMITNAETVKDGDVLFDMKAGHVSHWATCPDAAKWRKK
jgi:hypothetical protein